MRIVKCKKIYLSQNESDTWEKFEQILEGLDRESENPNTKNLISKIQSYLCELWEEIEDVE